MKTHTARNARLNITIAIVATITVVCALAQEKPAVEGSASQGSASQGSAIFDWDAVPAKPSSFGSGRQLFKGPTATLDQLDVHVTTLNPGQAPHPPHQHANEELIIVKEGTVEFLLNGEWKKAGPGSVIFVASNQLHGLRNPGPAPATYHVISWTSKRGK
jgi:quercetin dioxygenase-like cupin family protein